MLSVPSGRVLFSGQKDDREELKTPDRAEGDTVSEGVQQFDLSLSPEGNQTQG